MKLIGFLFCTNNDNDNNENNDNNGNNKTIKKKKNSFHDIIVSDTGIDNETDHEENVV